MRSRRVNVVRRSNTVGELRSYPPMQSDCHHFHRVFYRLVKGSLNNEKFALQRGILRQDTVRVCAFVYTIWSVKFDTRTATERLQIPKILHVAFAELSLPSFDLNKDTLQHYLVDKNAALVASAQKVRFQASDHRLPFSYEAYRGTCSRRAHPRLASSSPNFSRKTTSPSLFWCTTERPHCMH